MATTVDDLIRFVSEWRSNSLKNIQNIYFNTEAIRQVAECQQSLVSNMIKNFSTASCLEILNKACPTIKNLGESQNVARIASKINRNG